MTNNDILRRLRYAFDINDSKMIALFGLADMEVTREQISDWLKKDDDPAYKACQDIELATFLNGFINDRRGKKEGEQPKPEKRLTNNLIFRKLRIALDLKDDDILAILKLADYTLGKHELSAFFRKPDHRQYRDCKDQVLRNFLHGLQLKHRPDAAAKKDAVAAEPAVKTVAKKAAEKPAEASSAGKKKAFQWQSETAATVKKAAPLPKDAKPAFKWPEK